MTNELRKHLENHRKPVGEFQREDRYIVIKRSDLKKVPVSYRSHLVDPMFSLLAHLPHRECLVIESDWPEYEPAWSAIEARMSGASPQPPALGGEPEVFEPHGWAQTTGPAINAFTQEFDIAEEWAMAGYGTVELLNREHVDAEIDRLRGEHQAHLAPLQAELKSAIADKEAYGQNAIDLRKQVGQLNAQCDELHRMLGLAWSADHVSAEDCRKIDAALSKPAGSEAVTNKPGDARAIEERGSSHGFDQSPNTCRHDERTGVWWREGSVTRTGRECCACGSVEEDPVSPAGSVKP